MSRRFFSVCMLAVAVLATLVGAPGASAAKSKGPVPVITKVTPMRISVGGTLTIKGRHSSRRPRATRSSSTATDAPRSSSLAARRAQSSC